MLALNILSDPLYLAVLRYLPQESLSLASNLQAVKQRCKPKTCKVDLQISSPFAKHFVDPLSGHLLGNILSSLLKTLISLECDHSLPS